jgi:hypothetical protein
MKKINLDAEFSTNQVKARLLVMIRSLDIMSEDFEQKCRESARNNFESADMQRCEDHFFLFASGMPSAFDKIFNL